MSHFWDQIHTKTRRMDLQEVTNYLVANGYAFCVKGNYKFTAKFHRELKNAQISASVPAMQQTQPLVVAVSTDWETRYKQFIVDARVPARCEGRYGEVYATNKYSEDGMKAFRKAIESGCVYEMLVMSTALYYKSGVRLKQSIGRYMSDGTWKSDYDSLISSAEQNKVKEHIKETTDDGQHNFTRVG